jgi:Ser/Thr protein kinase RdoA (MazF antagonist)
MGSEFFDLPVEEQQSSLALFAKELLVQYGITNAQVSCINYEFNATFSVETESGVKYALRVNINSTRTIQNMLAEVEWVRHLNRTS